MTSCLMENRLNQLRNFLKVHRKVNGLYFELNFQELGIDKMSLELVDPETKMPLIEPVFSSECIRNRSKICIFNIETLSLQLKKPDFDENEVVVCPICKNSCPFMTFYYEQSLIDILEKIKKFIGNSEARDYRISIKSDFTWKTENYLYFKGVVECDYSFPKREGTKTIDNLGFLNFNFDDENQENFEAEKTEYFNIEKCEWEWDSLDAEYEWKKKWDSSVSDHLQNEGSEFWKYEEIKKKKKENFDAEYEWGKKIYLSVSEHLQNEGREFWNNEEIRKKKEANLDAKYEWEKKSDFSVSVRHQIEDEEISGKKKANLDPKTNNTKNNLDHFSIVPINTNILIRINLSDESNEMKLNRLVQNKKTLSPFIFYDKFVFLVCGDRFFVLNDAGSLFQNDGGSLSGFFGDSQILMKKIYSFAHRFHSPQILSLDEFIYLIGGYTFANKSLTNFSKISLSEEKIQNHLPLKEMINVRSEFQSIMMQNSREIYVFGGKIWKNNQFQIQNEIFDSYNINTDSWKEIQINGFSSYFDGSLIDFLERNDENSLLLFGGNCLYEVNISSKFADKKSLELPRNNKRYARLSSILKNSITKLASKGASLNIEKDKNLKFFKYYQ